MLQEETVRLGLQVAEVREDAWDARLEGLIACHEEDAVEILLELCFTGAPAARFSPRGVTVDGRKGLGWPQGASPSPLMAGSGRVRSATRRAAPPPTAGASSVTALDLT